MQVFEIITGIYAADAIQSAIIVQHYGFEATASLWFKRLRDPLYAENVQF